MEQQLSEIILSATERSAHRVTPAIALAQSSLSEGGVSKSEPAATWAALVVLDIIHKDFKVFKERVEVLDVLNLAKH